MATIGYNLELVECFWNRIQADTSFRCFHILHPSIDQHDLNQYSGTKEHLFLSSGASMHQVSQNEKVRLAALEQNGVPTIHSMIMSDRVVRLLDYPEALAYASHLMNRFEVVLRQIRPSVIISGFDGLHSSIGLAVSRKLGIPWFALHFSTYPRGLTGFCTGLTPDTAVAVQPSSPEALKALAEHTLSEFEKKRIAAPACLSASSFREVVKRLPVHLLTFGDSLHRAIAQRFDKFTQYPARRLAIEYLRKRRNMALLPDKWLVEDPPSTPFLFIGLHMQPESSIDVWAPFYSNQFNVIEAIARATPPTHELLIKLHKSDADNYSRRQLDRLRRLPGVRLVAPHASSRMFIEKAALVLGIQGNIALEAAMLGRPVLVFGDTKFTDFPSVSRVERITDLPEQIRNKLAEGQPTREEIVRGYMSYLSHFAPGYANNWEILPSDGEIASLSDQFRYLREFLQRRIRCAELSVL